MSATVFPTVDQFAVFLSEQKDIVFTSGMRSFFLFIVDYFKDKDFCQDNLRVMLSELRTSTKYKDKPLKKSTLNKYIRVVKLIGQFLRIHEFEAYDGYKSHETTESKGEIITDKEAERIAEFKMIYRYRSEEQEEYLNKKWRACFTMMRFLGTPPCDITAIKWENYKVTHFDYIRQKTAKHMVVPVPPILRHYMSELPRSGEYIFSGDHRMKEETIRQELRSRCQKLKFARGRRITPYSFRMMATAYSYMNSTSQTYGDLAKCFGHTIEVAEKHYDKMHNPKKLLDALMACHPGLQKKVDVDTVKRLALDFLSKLVDTTKYEVELAIQPKCKNVRHLTIS